MASSLDTPEMASILNHPPQRLEGPAFLHELVDGQRNPELLAVDGLLSDGTRQKLSYAELHKAADSLAVQILNMVPEPSRSHQFVVPLLIPQCPSLYVAMLAILKAGGGFCPLQLDAPPERIKFILEDVGASIVLASPGFVDRILASGEAVEVITIPEQLQMGSASASDSSQRLADIPRSKDSLAYVMYTSGSTGTPKGVGISHSAATQSLLAHDRHIPSFDRFLQFASPTFDVSVFEIFFPLFRGSTLVSCDRSTMLDDLPSVIGRLEVDACELTPTVVDSLLRARSAVPTLRLLLTIGEMLTDRVVAEFGGDANQPSILWGMYGPTEAAIHCTLQSAFPTTSSPKNIGIPLDTVSCFIARIPEDDEVYTFDLVQPGTAGELVVGGFQLATSYLNRPEQTNKSFIETKFGRLYRTGDRALLRQEGTIECLGRIADGQIKLRGQRIELGEVEHAILRDPSCQSAIAMVIGGIIVAFCTAEDGVDLALMPVILSDTCKRWLPSFMVPGDIVCMEGFPRLSSGKINRQLLKQKYQEEKEADPADEDANHHVTVSDPLVVQVMDLISQTLEARMDQTSKLAAHGLDSLKAIRVASVLRANQVNATALEILQASTIASLCDTIRDKSADQLQSQEVRLNVEELISADPSWPTSKNDIEAAFPCTPLQSSMLFETAANSSAYHNNVELEFPSACSIEMAKSAIERLAENNDILRSRFLLTQTGFVRAVYRRLPESQIQIIDSDTLNASPSPGGNPMHPFVVQISNPTEYRGPRAMLWLHHAAYDGWTIDLITHDLSIMMDDDQVPYHRPQFDQVSSFYHNLSSSSLDKSRSYWAEHLLDWQTPGFPKMLDRPSEKPSQGSMSRKLDITTNQLSGVAERLSCHPQAIFQAALVWLWGSLLGGSDVVIGNVASGRTIPVDGIDQVMGPCITPAPLRVNLDTVVTGTHLIRAIQATNRQALEHSLLPLSEIRKAAGIASGYALYDLLFVYQETLYSRDRASRKVREVSHRDSLETKILIEIEPTDGDFFCHMTFHTDAVTQHHAELMLEQINAISEQLIAQPDILIGEFHEALPAHTTSIYNHQPSHFDGIPDLASSFERTARSSPDAMAVCFATSITDTETVVDSATYAQLDIMSNQLAWKLRSEGAHEGGIVAVVMEKSVLMYAAILATVKAGCAYLPLLPSTPVERTQTILGQTSVDLCLTDSASVCSLSAALKCRVVDVEALDRSDLPSEHIPRSADGSRPAYIIYTSGTTGVPKGIVVSQLNVVSNLDVLAKIYPVNGPCRLLQLCSQAFDVSVFEIFFTWTVGGCLCSGTNDVLYADIERAIRALRCTHLSMTPTVAALVHPANVPEVRFLVTAGEPMTAAVASEWGELLYQGYGPAETTNICTVKNMRQGDYIGHLGFAFHNTSVFVLSPGSTAVVPLGAYGEFCFGGDQVALGYLGLPDVTGAKFLDHPALGRIYRSGDMGRMLPDGSLLISGRLDGQVKLRGQRIETGEVDSVVTSSAAAVSAASLIIQSRTSSRYQLVCFYVPTGHEDHDTRALQFNHEITSFNTQLYSLLRSKVPGYMVPSLLVPISSVPLTSSGKTDKRRLQREFELLEQSYLEEAAELQSLGEEDSEWTSIEQQVAFAVSKTLGVPVDELNRWLPLTAHGLDSISAITLCQHLEALVGRRPPISALLRDPSIAQIAQLVNEHRDTEIGSNLPSFPPDWVEQATRACSDLNTRISTILPCSPLQEAMLSSTSSASYINQLVLRLRAPRDSVRLSWGHLVRRHGILRTCFLTTPDAHHSMAQVVLEEWPLPWSESHYDSLQDATSSCAQGLPASLDSHTPPYRLDIITVGAGYDEYLCFTCHHALYDGDSMRILLSELEDLIRGQPLPDPVPYESALRYVMALPESTMDFWRRTFQQFPSAQRRLTLSPDATSIMLQRPAPISLRQIQKAAKQYGVSLLTICQAAWAITLGVLTEQEDVCFGNVMSGRTIPVKDINRLIGPCFNTIPFRVRMEEDSQLSGLLKKLHHANIAALEYQFTPLRQVKRAVTQAGADLFDTILLLQRPQARLDPKIWELVEDSGDMDVPLVCELTPDADEDVLVISLHSHSTELCPKSLETVYEAFAYVLSSTTDCLGVSIPRRADLSPEIVLGLSKILISESPGVHQNTEQGRSSTAEDDSEWNDTERSIRSILTQLSNVPERRIARHTTIFQLGLDSINAVQAAHLLRRQGHDVTTIDIMGAPSCSALAVRLGQKATLKESSGDGTSYPTLDLSQFERQILPALQRQLDEEVDIESLLPCTPVQCGMLSDFIRSQGTDYFNSMSFILPDSFTRPQVSRAWAELIRHQSILRTGFAPVDHPHTTFAMVQYATGSPDLIFSGYSSGDSFEVAEWRRQCSQQSFKDLSQPPWRVALELSSGQVQMHLVMLHALYDAESLQILLHDLHEILLGQAPQHPHSNKAALSHILGAATSTEGSESFWQSLSSSAVLNRFPTLTPLMERPSEIAAETLTSRTDLSQLNQGAKEAGVTPQAILQAAWAWVLSAYLGEPDVVFGVVLSGRSSPATQTATIPCITTLPVIAHVGESRSELIQSMMRYNTEMAAYQHTPLAKIQRWLGHPGNRLFDTLLVYQKNFPSGRPELPWQVVHDEGKLDYAISLEVEPSQKGDVRLRLSFKPSVLPKQQASLLLSQFDAVLDALSQHTSGDERPIWTTELGIFSILPPLEANIPSEELLLHQFVESAAVRWPTRTAIEFVAQFHGKTPDSQTWNFEELDQMGNRIANLLVAGTEHTSGIVAIHFDKCPEALFSILGILKAGFSFLALDPSAPKDRKEFILHDSKAIALLSGDGEFDFVPCQPVIRVSLLSLHGISKKPPSTRRSIREEDTCYCLYTSGTTGTPKGCEITHNNAVQAMKAFQRLFHGHWDGDSRWLQFASFHFDVTVLEQYWTWSVGMTLVSAPRDLILDDIAGTIRRLRITHIDLTPSLARLLDPSDVPTLCKGVFVTGGEALKQEILDVWGPPGVIYNAYGPTEATIGVTMYQRVPKNGRASNIGRQFDNVGSYVLQPGTDIPVLRGAVGELCVSGKLVGKGYLNRPELTQERFPTLATFGERVYRTGDLVRVLHDGCFEFLGRADDQVKLRGQRLELGEINHVIRSGVPTLRDAVTLVGRDQKLEKDLLVSFVTSNTKARSHGDPEVILDRDAFEYRREVQRVCRDKLPGYMVPSVVLQVSFIPLSVNNKADLKILRRLFNNLAPEQILHSSSGPAPDPAVLSSLQTRLLQSAQKFSDSPADSLSLSSNLFDFGLDSISALRLCRLLKQNGLAAATPTLVLRNPLLEDLAEALKENSHTDDSIAGLRDCQQNLQAFDHRVRSQVLQEMTLPPNHTVEYIVPCTPLQEGMLARTLGRQENAYFVTFHLELHNTVSLPRYRLSWENLVANHAILRTQFIQTSAGFAQVAVRETGCVWEEAKCQDGDIEAAIVNIRDLWIRTNRVAMVCPFKLSLFETPTRRTLVVQVFHGLYDGTSLGLMLDWVTRDYERRDQIVAPRFVDAMPYGPARQFHSSRSFWRAHLAGCRYDLQPKSPKGSTPPVQSATKTLPIQKLEHLCKHLKVTMQTLVLAVWSAVFSKHISKEAAFGVVSSGRSLELDGVENVVGPLFNTLPFFANASDLTWQSLIQRCHEYNSAVMQFQHAPLRDVQKWCSNGHAIFNSLFVFHGQMASTPETDLLCTVDNGPLSPDYPLAFEATIGKAHDLQVQIVAQVDDAHDISAESLLEDFEVAYASLNEQESSVMGMQSAPISTTTSAAPTPQSLESSTSSPAAVSTGHSTPDVHGCDFEWSPAAIALRDELSELAKVTQEEITPTTSFFELGLDSVDLVVLSSRLKNIGLRISLSQLMRAQTISLVSSLMETDPSGNTNLSESSFDALKLQLWTAVKPSGWDMNRIETVLPPTPLQESMVADMLESGFERYFNHATFEIDPTADLQLLTNAWLDVIRETPTLRTVFRHVQDTAIPHSFVQVVLRDPGVRIDVRHLSGMEQLDHIAAGHKRRAMVANGASALLQISVAHISQKTYLVLSIAHALYDGWSLALLHGDVAAAYRGAFTTRPIPEASIRSLLQPPTEQARAFWSQYLSQAPPSLLPVRHVSVTETVHQAEIKSYLSSSAAAAFCKNHFITLQTLGQACWASVLASWLGRLDVSFGVVLSGRDTEEMHNIMFPTMNTVAVRCVLHGSRASFLRYMQGSMADVYQHQTFPLRQAQLLSKNGPGRLFNTLFLLQRQPHSASTLAENESLLRPVSGQAATDFAVCIELEAVEDELHWRVSSQDEFCDSDGTAKILRQLEEVLHSFVDCPDLGLLAFDGDSTSVCGQPAFQSTPNNPGEEEIKQPTLPEGDDSDVWSPAEDTIRRTLSDVTGIPAESITKSNTLYQLGLDSISAIKVASILRKEGIVLAVRNLLAASSISALAQQARSQDEMQPSQDVTSYVLPTRIDVQGIMQRSGLPEGCNEDVLPALPMQVYMMTAWQNSGGNVFYHSFRYRLATHLPLDKLRTAWASLVASDPLLRTCLLATADREIPFIQVILKADVMGPHQQIHENESDPSDSMSACWPFVRLTAHSAGENQWELCLRIHHALYDGVSMASLIARLGRLLSHNNMGQTRDAGSQMTAWKGFISQHYSPSNVSARKSFWTTYLAGLGGSDSANTRESSAARTSYLEPSGLVNMPVIEAACARRGIGFSSLLFAAVANALHEGDGPKRKDIVLGLYLANRTEIANSDDAALPKLNLLPCRVSLNPHTDIFDQALSIQKDVLDITSPPNSTASLTEIKDWTGIEVDVFVNFLNLPTDKLAPGPVEELDPRPSNMPSPEIDALWLSGNAVRDAFPDSMDIEASIRGMSLAIGVFGSESRVSRTSAERLVAGVVRILGSCVRDETPA